MENKDSINEKNINETNDLKLESTEKIIKYNNQQVNNHKDNQNVIKN